MTNTEGADRIYAAIWAKSGNPWHPLLNHMVDAAVLAQAVLFREPRRTLTLYTQDWKLSIDQTVRWVAFLVGLHDLGKASPVFQMTWPEGAERVERAGFTWDRELAEYPVAHGVFTEVFLQRLLKEKGVTDVVARDLAKALGAHHGFPATAKEKKDARRHLCLEGGRWWEARSLLFEELARHLGVIFPEVAEARPEAVLRVMALASLADWVASDPDLFPYGRDPRNPRCLEEAKILAEKALNRLGWRPFHLPPTRTFTELFPQIPRPNALQEAMPRLLEGVQQPLLLLVEAPMGIGKTEAALYAHHILQRCLEHRGIYMALPTQATGNGLFPRVQNFLERLGATDGVELQLQHGSALLNPQYEALLARARPTQVWEGTSDAEEGGVTAATWFSARKRAMLAPHGVGTLDQALLGVLRVRHHFIRLWGLMNRLVVLDEVHAYDVYTSGLLRALLRWLRALGSSAIVMTATLPRSRRLALLSAWMGERVDFLDLGPYPRVALFPADGPPRVTALPQERDTEVSIERVPVEVEGLVERLRGELPGVLGAIVNTVDRAQALYQALGEGKSVTLGALLRTLFQLPEPLRALAEERGEFVVGKELPDGTLVFLLHARFPAEERAVRESLVLCLLGKPGPRPGRAVLVATQVAEQSLDLDFDFLYSDFAPLDLLFQRAGRLHRHERHRPPKHGQARVLLGVPEALDFGAPLYWSRVYEDFILLSTWKALEGRQSVRIPRDLEPLLEEVYEDGPESFHHPLRKRAEESYARLKERMDREEQTAKALALFRLEALLAYGDATDVVAQLRLEDDTEEKKTQRLLTRLGEPSVAVVPLYRVSGGLHVDPDARRPIRLTGELSKEEALDLSRRAVRLSRYPIPQILLGEDPPTAWKRNAILRGLRVLEVGRVFGDGKTAFRVELDPELGVVYVRL